MKHRLGDLLADRPIIHAEAISALEAQGVQLSYPNVARQEAVRTSETARRAAQEVLGVICRSDDVPMLERAGWSTAFHRDHASLTSIEDFAARAERHHADLTSIDEALQEPGAPILAISTGPLGDTRKPGPAMRYAVARSAGEGLDVSQEHNRVKNWHYHLATATQQGGNSPVWRNFAGRRRFDPVISDISTRDLLATCADPSAVVEHVQNGREPLDSRYYVIGDAAIAAFFEKAEQSAPDPRFDMLYGAVAMAGVPL